MKKRVFSLLLITALLLSCFAACSKDDDAVSALTTDLSIIETGPTFTPEQTATQPKSEPAPETTGVPPESESTPEEPLTADTSGQKLVALTFDDGPGPYTRRLIEGLNARGAKATFFMLGQQAVKHPDTIQFMYESGHQLGSHTYSHKDITQLTNEAFLEEMQKTDDAIKAACGQVATAFRPPYGAYNAEKLALQDKTPTHWSVDTEDWSRQNAQAVKEHIVTHAKDGSIILVHDIYETSVDGALAAVDALMEQGFKFVTVNELVVRNGAPITPHEIYFSCVPKNNAE